jgi:hypothetical protein
VVLRGESSPFRRSGNRRLRLQCTVMMEARPATAIRMPEADFLLEVLIIALDAPAHLGEIDKAAERYVRVDGCEPVLVGVASPLGHYAARQTMPNGFVFPSIRTDRQLNGSA